MTQRTCTIEDCNREHVARGYCMRHYGRLHRAGLLRKVTAEERFAQHVERQGECLVWTKARNEDGYGILSANGKSYLAHRFAWEQAHGEIPKDREIDHRCWNRACVEPTHLRLATNKQNGENQSGPTRFNKSGIRGVYWHKANKKWVVQAGHNGRKYYAGQFVSIQEAEAAAIALRNRLFTFNEADRKAS